MASPTARAWCGAPSRNKGTAAWRGRLGACCPGRGVSRLWQGEPHAPGGCAAGVVIGDSGGADEAEGAVEANGGGVTAADHERNFADSGAAEFADGGLHESRREAEFAIARQDGERVDLCAVTSKRGHTITGDAAGDSGDEEEVWRGFCVVNESLARPSIAAERGSFDAQNPG